VTVPAEKKANWLVHGFEFFGLSVAGVVGQKLSEVFMNFKCRISNGEYWSGRGCGKKVVRKNTEHPTSNAENRTGCDGMNADINAKSQGRENAMGYGMGI
jgi:hypothetical protein